MFVLGFNFGTNRPFGIKLGMHDKYLTLSTPLPCGKVTSSYTGLTASYKTLGVVPPLIIAHVGCVW